MQWIARPEVTDDGLGELTAQGLLELAREQRRIIRDIRQLATNEIMNHDGCSGCLEGRLAMLDTFGLDRPNRTRLVVGVITDIDPADPVGDGELDDALLGVDGIDTTDVFAWSSDYASSVIAASIVRQLEKAGITGIKVEATS